MKATHAPSSSVVFEIDQNPVSTIAPSVGKTLRSGLLPPASEAAKSVMSC